MKKFLPFIFSVALIVTAYAQNPNLGTGGAQFLQIPIGARAEAMAGAVMGCIDDASSVFWNPAGMVKVKNVEVFFSYMDWFTLFDHSAASIVYNVEDVGAFGASLIIFNTREMEITTELEPNGTGRFFDAGDMAIGISYAKYLTDRFSVGLTAKYIYQQIWNETATGFAFDIGTQYRLDFQNLTIAMSMSNFGGDLRFDGPDLDINYDREDIYPLSRIVPGRLQTEDYPLPLQFQVGIGFDVFKADFVKMRGDIDATHPNDNSERVLFGTEFSFFDRFFVRGGYKYNFDDQKFAFGAGANVPVGGSAIYFDYAYSVYDLLPGVHRISVKLCF
jgi:hypothetical protein